MPPRIYSPENLREDAEITLDKGASTHVAKVLRMKAGERLIAFSGDGYDYSARILSLGKQVTIRLETREKNCRESPLRITLAQGISRSDRMDYTIQKAVELGVHAIQPLSTQKSTVRLDASRAEKKLRHWQSVVVSACEQCGRSVIPAVSKPVSLTDWLATSGNTLRILLDPDADTSLPSIQLNGACTLLVGPESGFSDEETDQLRSAGTRGVTLGPRILRTETAAAAAISILQSQHGDLR